MSDNPLEKQHKRLNTNDSRTVAERSRLLSGRLIEIDDRDLVYLAMTIIEGCGCCAGCEVGDPMWNLLAKELVDRLEVVV